MKNPTAPKIPTIPTIGPYGRWEPSRLFSGAQAGHWSGGCDPGAFSPAYIVQGRDGHWTGDMTAGGV